MLITCLLRHIDSSCVLEEVFYAGDNSLAHCNLTHLPLLPSAAAARHVLCPSLNKCVAMLRASCSQALRKVGERASRRNTSAIKKGLATCTSSRFSPCIKRSIARVGTLNDTRHLKFRHSQSFAIKKAQPAINWLRLWDYHWKYS